MELAESRREVRTPNACSEHKMQHQKCPKDCPNRNSKIKKSKAVEDLEEVVEDCSFMRLRRGKRVRRSSTHSEEDL
jgi:hypothetical protein